MAASRNTHSKSFALLIFIIALVFLGIGGYMKWQQIQLHKKCTSNVTGRVETVFKNVKSSRKTKTGRRIKKYQYSVDVSYTVDDEGYIVTVEKLQHAPAARSTVSVKYDPSDPKTAYLPAYEPNGYLSFLLFGGAAVILSIMEFVAALKRPSGDS